MYSEAEMFESFRRRPAMFTGEYSLKSLGTYLDGYRFAMEMHGLLDRSDPFLIPYEFHDWVAYRLHFYESTSGWVNMIRDRTSSEQEAIERFFGLLDEFKVRTPKVVARIHCPGLTYLEGSCERDDNEVVFVERPYPDSISLVTYTDDHGFFAYSDTSDTFPAKGYHPDLDLFEMMTGLDRSRLLIVDETWDPRPFSESS